MTCKRHPDLEIDLAKAPAPGIDDVLPERHVPWMAVGVVRLGRYLPSYEGGDGWWPWGEQPEVYVW